MIEEIKNKFLPKINNEKIILNNSVAVRIDIFYELFKDAKNVSYDELMRINGEENEKGYRDFFEQCKAEGILK